MSRRAETH
uniref:Uncharacterized protein n=1 Tax=Rhizophora mucronata TaxID=61149 RepID=A0A2P2PT28_RHIMU